MIVESSGVTCELYLEVKEGQSGYRLAVMSNHPSADPNDPLMYWKDYTGSNCNSQLGHRFYAGTNGGILVEAADGFDFEAEEDGSFECSGNNNNNIYLSDAIIYRSGVECSGRSNTWEIEFLA